MAIIQAILALLAHSTGKVANLAFAWATTMLFGRVPDDRQVVLSIICLIAFVWLIAVIGVAFPLVATFLLSFAAPKWLDQNFLRLVMLGLSIVAPLISGGLAILLRQPGGSADFKSLFFTVIKGYPLTLGLALTLLVLVVLAPCVKVVDIFKRWQSTHVPVQIKPEHYPQVVDQVAAAAKDNGFQYTKTKSSAVMRFPLRILMMLSGSTFKAFVTDNLTTLKLHNGEIAIYPADIVIRADKHDSGMLQSAITERLAFSSANLTWTADAQHLEDMIRQIGADYDAGRLSPEDAQRRVDWLTKAIAAAGLDFKEWQTVFMDKLLLERHLYKTQWQRQSRRRSA